MAIEHRNIPESGLHEPKGVSSAASNRVYISNGSGSGSWSPVDADALQGTISNASGIDQQVITDGSGGFRVAPVSGANFGSMVLTDNATAKAVTAAVDPTLNTPSDFQELDLAFTFENVTGMISGSNFLETTSAGQYLVNLWMSVGVDTANTRVAFKLVINDTVYFPRGPKTYISPAGEFFNLASNEIKDFNAGDQVKVFLASDKAVNVTIEDFDLQIVYLGE